MLDRIKNFFRNKFTRKQEKPYDNFHPFGSNSGGIYNFSKKTKPSSLAYSSGPSKRYDSPQDDNLHNSNLILAMAVATMDNDSNNSNHHNHQNHQSNDYNHVPVETPTTQPSYDSSHSSSYDSSSSSSYDSGSSGGCDSSSF